MIFSLSDKPIRLTIPPVVIHDRVWGAPVAQLDRASDYGSEGLEFDSLRVYHFFCLFLALHLLISRYLQRFSPRNAFLGISRKIRKNKLKSGKIGTDFGTNLGTDFFGSWYKCSPQDVNF